MKKKENPICKKKLGSVKISNEPKFSFLSTIMEKEDEYMRKNKNLFEILDVKEVIKKN